MSSVIIDAANKFFAQFAVGYYSETKIQGIVSEHFVDALKAHVLYSDLKRVRYDGVDYYMSDSIVEESVITDIHDRLSELADIYPESSANKVEFPDRGGLITSFYSLIDSVYLNGSGCDVAVDSGYVTFYAIDGFDVFNRSATSFWNTITIYDGDSYKWALSDLNAAFIEANGTVLTQSTLFLGDYDGVNVQSALPIMVYEGVRTDDQKTTIETFIDDYSTLLDEDGRCIYDPYNLTIQSDCPVESGTSTGGTGTSDGKVSLTGADERTYLVEKLGAEFSNDGSRFHIKLDGITAELNDSNEVSFKASGIDHDALLNYVADEHIAPDEVTITINASNKLEAANNYVDSIAFSDGSLTLGRGELSDLVVSLDGRYLQDGDIDLALEEYYTKTEVNSLNVSTFTNDAGYKTTDSYVTGISFDITSGDLSLQRGVLGDVSHNLDNRYALISSIGVANGIVPLGSNGLISSVYLPAYVDEIQEYANFASFPQPGLVNIIYLDLSSDNIFRWGGTVYVAINPGSVTSIFGRDGIVVAQTGDYSTCMITESDSCLYYTNVRARAAISVTGDLAYDSTTGVIGYTQPVNVSAFSNDAGYLTGGDVVDLSTDQTIGGNKTFNGTVQLDNGFVITNGAADGYILSTDAFGNTSWIENTGGHDAVTLSGENYLTITDQLINVGQVDLASTNVTGILPRINGGTGVSDFDSSIYELLLPDTPDSPDSKFLNGNRLWTEIALGSGGYAANLYLSATASDITGYKTLSYTNDLTETECTASVSSGDGEVLCDVFLFDEDLGIEIIPAGKWSLAFYGKVSSAVGETHIRPELFVRHIDDSETIFDTATSEEINNTDYPTTPHEIEKSLNQLSVVTTDRLGIRFYASTTSNTARTITVIVGDGRGAYVTTPLELRHNQLRDLNGDAEYQHMSSAEKLLLNNMTLQNVTSNGATTDVFTSFTGGLGSMVGDDASFGWLASKSTGTSYTAIGHQAARYNLVGGDFVALGRSAAQNSTDSYFVAIGSSAAAYNLTGQEWIAIGNNTARQIVGGGAATDFSASTYIGASVTVSANGVTNENAIGYHAIGKGSNTVAIGNSSITDNYFYGNINAVGELSGSNLSGINTGDQDLSSYALSTDLTNVAYTNVNNNFSVLQDITGGLSIAGTTVIDASRNINASNVVASGNGTFGDNVGIGTASPQENLHVSNSNGGKIRLSDTGATTDTEVSSIVEYYRGNTINRVGYIGFGSSNTTQLSIMNSAGSSALYDMGSLKLETTSTGIDVTGNSVVSGTVTAADYTVGGTTVIDASRNINTANVVATGSGSFGGVDNPLAFTTKHLGVTSTTGIASLYTSGYRTTNGLLSSLSVINSASTVSTYQKRVAQIAFNRHNADENGEIEFLVFEGDNLYSTSLNSSGFNIAGNAVVSGTVTATNVFNKATQTLSGTTVTYNCSTSINAKITLTGNTTMTLTNLVNGMSGNIKVTQDATGSRTLTLSPTPDVINGGAGVIVLTGTASSTDIISWWYDGTDLNVTYGLNYN